MGVGSSCVIALCLCPFLVAVAPEPSTELLRGLAALGGTFVIAYAIEFSAIARTLQSRGVAQEAYLGVIVGTGICGLASIGTALGLSERADLDHWQTLDQLAFSFTVGSLLVLGFIVVLMPLLAYERKRLAHLDPDD